MTIASCVVDTSDEADLPAGAQIVDKCWLLIDLKIVKLKYSTASTIQSS